MLISLAVMCGVFGIAAHMATEQLRFFRGIGEVATVRGQIAQTGAIAERVLWGVSPPGGDIVMALDSALEVHMPIGTAVACAGTAGRVTIPAGAPARGAALAAFADSPEPGDRMVALFEDSLSATWLTLRVAATPVPDACARFPGVSSAVSIALKEPLEVPAGAALRFTRPFRLSLYRASDNRWYLGAKDWNEEQQRFNSIQPVAGPLREYSADAAKTGLLFVYRDGQGTELAAPIETSRIASVTIVARGASVRAVRVRGIASSAAERYEDSTSVTVALRNAR